MPWYWTDDLARALITQGMLDETDAHQLTAAPVALRRDEPTVDAAALALLEDDEIPLPVLAA